MTLRVPASLRLTVPLIVLGFAAVLSAINVLYHVPRAEQAVEDDVSKRVAQEMSRLQSTLEYLLLKGDIEVAQREIAVLAHNHDYIVVVLTNDENEVIAATRRAWLERPIADVLPKFDPAEAAAAIRERRGRLAVNAADNAVHGYAGILMGSQREEVRPSRAGSLFLAYDLLRPKSEARAQVLQQSLYWAGWVTALALLMWLLFHFLLTRRTARLVHAAEQLAAGNLAARSGLQGRDELARLGLAFDAMAVEVAQTQTRLRRDLEARIEIQRALEDSEEQYRSMFDASIDGLVLWNATGQIVDINPAMSRICGFDEPAAAHTSSRRVLNPTSHPDLHRAVMSGEPWHGEISDVRRGGAPLELEVHAVPMHYRGKPHVLTIARDITEKKNAAAELVRQRETLHQREKLAALGSLLAGVSHELNNPLSVVVVRAVLLEEQGAPGIRVAAERIRTAAERCARIVRTFLAMARQQKPEPGPVAVNDVVSAALDITGYAVRTSAIDVALDLADDIPCILADEDQLHQVMLNLIINAQQALQGCPLPRSIRIATRFDASAAGIRITVADSGPGIPESLRARIFEPYFTTKPIGVGTGVGLAVSAGIVEAHGGALSVHCPPDGGTVFTIALPFRAADAAGDDPVGAACAESIARTVLVVDDEAEVREVLREILSSAQHRVETASSGREALLRLEARHYDVVLTDIRMPDMDGLTLFEEVKRRWPERAARVVFVTGDTLSEALRELADSGRCAILEKPFAPGDVRRAVTEVVTTREKAARSQQRG
ncbi:MAG: response regulator [Burkholderiales bacterium]